MKLNYLTYQIMFFLVVQFNSFSQNDTTAYNDGVVKKEAIEIEKKAREEEYTYDQDDYYNDDNDGVYEEDFGVDEIDDVVNYKYPDLEQEDSDAWQEVETKTYETNTISEETVEKYLKDRSFKYVKKNGQGVQSERGWLNSFVRAIQRIIEKIFGFKISEDAFIIIKWILIALVFGTGIFLLLKYLGVSLNFRRTKKKPTTDISFEEIEENLEEIDFKALIENAIKSKSYRIAVRLYFLKNLQSLTKRDLIEWEIDKTNVDYKYELASTRIKDEFDEIVYLYEHIWYGDFDLDEEEYQKAINVFQKFDKRLGV